MILQDWSKIKKGDEVTTEGFGPCSGGDSYNIWEKVLKVDNNKIYVDGWDSYFDLKTRRHKTMSYGLCRLRTFNP